MAKIDVIIGCLPLEKREPTRCYIEILLTPDNIDGLVECLLKGDFQAFYEYIVARMNSTQLGAAHGRIQKILKERKLQGKPRLTIQQAMVGEALKLLLKVSEMATRV